jgi:hypothetical protein
MAAGWADVAATEDRNGSSLREKTDAQREDGPRCHCEPGAYNG